MLSKAAYYLIYIKRLIVAIIIVLIPYYSYVNAEQAQYQDFHIAYNTDEFISDRLCLIDSVYGKLVSDKLMPHAVALVIKNGNIIHYKAYGWRNIEDSIPCERDDIFRIASQTKAITACALMTLWEEGLFQLDEPIKKYLPEFSNPQVLLSYDSKNNVYKTRKAKRDITIRDLLTHTSGISYKGIHGKIKSNNGVPTLMSKEPITLETAVERLAKLPLAHDPGEKFTYSMNIEVIGRLIEVLSGKPIDVFLKERIFDPIGMIDTYFYLPDEKKERLVTLYRYPKGGPLQESSNELYCTYPISGAKTYFSTGAGLCGTAIDYAKFCQMVLNGGSFNNHRILGRKTLEMMQRNNTGDLRGDIGFGLAWDVFRPEYIHLTPASEGSMRWGGMFGTDYLIDPKENLIIIMYVNWDNNGTTIDTKTLLHNLVYQAIK